MHSFISWYGGKNKMAKKIISIMPKHKNYVEVFGGGAHILLNKKRSPLEVYNDVNFGLVSLFRTVRVKEHAQELKRLLELTPYSREEFEYAKLMWDKGLEDNSSEFEELKNKLEQGEITQEEYDKKWRKLDMERFYKYPIKIKEKMKCLNSKMSKGEISREEYNKEFEKLEEERIKDQIERARMFYVLCMQSFSSGLQSWKFDKNSKSIGLSPCIKRYLNSISKDIDYAVERFKTVQIENMSYEYILEKYDSPETLFYLDPPYIHDTRGESARNVYHYELEDSLHKDLVERLMKIKGKFILSGYDHQIYDPLNDGKRFFKVKLDDFAKACQFTQKGDKKDRGEEFLWINFKL